MMSTYVFECDASDASARRWPAPASRSAASQCSPAHSADPSLKGTIHDDPHDAVPVLLSDLNMLLLSGGQERANAEYARLLAAAGLRPGQIQPVATPYGVIEGLAV